MLKKYRTQLGYVMVSLSSTAIELFFFRIFTNLLRKVWPFWYLNASNILARVFSDSYKYFMDRGAVFRAEGSVPVSMVKFFVLIGSKTLLSGWLLTLLVFATRGNEMLLKMAVDVALFFPGYVLEKKWVHGK